MIHYREIWKEFLVTQAKDYEAAHGLSKDLIKKIGYKKFIKANDWRRPEDAAKWRTDVMRVIPCPHCGKDFGLFDDEVGLCSHCLPKFNLKAFWADVSATAGGSYVKIMQAVQLFVVDPEFRKRYLIRK